jgi:hypothetical protein
VHTAGNFCSRPPGWVGATDSVSGALLTSVFDLRSEFWSYF